jgi:hypothetical protein
MDLAGRYPEDPKDLGWAAFTSPSSVEEDNIPA